MAETGSKIPSQLAKFPADIKAAYARYLETGDPEAVQLIVLAALADFMPKHNKIRTTPLTDELRLVADMGYDSLAVAEAVFFLEDLFEVRIGNDDLLNLETVGELREFVTNKLAEKNPAPTQ